MSSPCSSAFASMLQDVFSQILQRHEEELRQVAGNGRDEDSRIVADLNSSFMKAEQDRSTSKSNPGSLDEDDAASQKRISFTLIEGNYAPGGNRCAILGPEAQVPPSSLHAPDERLQSKPPTRSSSKRLRKTPTVLVGHQTLPVWLLDEAPSPLTPTRKRKVSICSMQSSVTSEELATMPTLKDRQWCMMRCLDSLVMKPSSKLRLSWDCFGLVLILYDLFWLPLQAFDPDHGPFVNFVGWLSSVFWSLDILASCFVGYVVPETGLLEMSVRRIAQHYALGWFPLDFVVILIDWGLNAMAIISSDESKWLANAETFRLARVGRYLRMLRLLRVLKAMDVVGSLLERVSSESARILLGIAKLLAFIVMINHQVACLWFAVGTMADSQGSGWIQKCDMGDESILYKYSSALHWSVTQFTPASMEIFATNSLERFFSVTVILLAMVMFSSFISTITNAMTQLRNLNKSKLQQMAMLRRYFTERKVSTGLVARINESLHNSWKTTHERVHQEDVVVLGQLSTSLKADLMAEVHVPTLCWHPFFLRCSEYYLPETSKICLTATATISLPASHELFHAGQCAEVLYFVLSGEVSYSHEFDDNRLAMQAGSLTSKTWLAEAGLWMHWKHQGVVTGIQLSEILSISYSKVQEILSDNLEQHLGARRYALIFAKYFDQHPDQLSDIWADEQVLEAIVSSAFIQEERKMVNPELSAFNRQTSNALNGQTSNAFIRQISAGSVDANLREIISRVERHEESSDNRYAILGMVDSEIEKLFEQEQNDDSSDSCSSFGDSADESDQEGPRTPHNLNSDVHGAALPHAPAQQHDAPKSRSRGVLRETTIQQPVAQDCVSADKDLSVLDAVIPQAPSQQRDVQAILT